MTPFSCLGQLEDIIFFFRIQRQIKFRSSRSVIGHISIRGQEVNETGFLVGVE